MSDAPVSPLLEVRLLAQHFPVRGLIGRQTGSVPALDDVSFAVQAGEVLGIVGESGAGKTTLGRTLAGILEPTRGAVQFAGALLAAPGIKRAVSTRARLQYVHQDPGASLNPSWTLRRALHEPLIIHTDWTRATRAEKIREIIAAAGLVESHLDLYPHELSGGQLRRAGLARVLVLNPELVILDEPTAGLDVSVRAMVLALLQDLRRRFSLTYLLISHDLFAARSICDRIAVLYRGKLVEIGPTERIFVAPRHPYTRALLAALPRIGGARITEGFAHQGEAHAHPTPSAGCRFYARCPFATPACAVDEPKLTDDAGHGVACFRWQDISPIP